MLEDTECGPVFSRPHDAGNGLRAHLRELGGEGSIADNNAHARRCRHRTGAEERPVPRRGHP
jgi:hypothetical protein